MKREITDIELKKILLNNNIFEYKSYDHKKAIEYYKETDLKNYNLQTDNGEYEIACWYLPDNIKEKFSYWRIGKLRSIRFNPLGDILDFKVGAKYPITFSLKDFNTKIRLPKKK